MSDQKSIDVEAEKIEPTAALAIKQEQVPATVTNPLDLEPAAFKAGLDRRKENRKNLMEWVRSAMVEGVDFGKIHTVGKSKCDKGKYCTNASHFSKPSLFKPGAEKICGMLGVTPTFPTIKDYEAASLEGRTIKNIILRCEILNSSGQTVAVGTGARSLEQDYGDMNKAMKMAEKSAHIDATLRMAGLSEVFTQDVEDMARLAQDEPEPPRPPSRPTQAPPTRPAQPSDQPAPVQKVPPSVVSLRKKFIANLEEADIRDKAMQFLIDLTWMMPTESLETMEDRYIPTSKEQYLAFLQALMVHSATGKATKPYVPGDKIGSTKDVPHGTVAVPRDSNPDPDSPDAPWRSFPVTFGKHAGTKLADLDKGVLWGFWENFTPQVEWEDKEGKVHQTKPEKLAKDRKFREMLDEAGKHYEFKHSDEKE